MKFTSSKILSNHTKEDYCLELAIVQEKMDYHTTIGEIVGIFHANQTTKGLRNQGRTKGEGWSTAN